MLPVYFGPQLVGVLHCAKTELGIDNITIKRPNCHPLSFDPCEERVEKSSRPFPIIRMAMNITDIDFLDIGVDLAKKGATGWEKLWEARRIPSDAQITYDGRADWYQFTWNAVGVRNLSDHSFIFDCDEFEPIDDGETDPEATQNEIRGRSGTVMIIDECEELIERERQRKASASATKFEEELQGYISAKTWNVTDAMTYTVEKPKTATEIRQEIDKTLKEVLGTSHGKRYTPDLFMPDIKMPLPQHKHGIKYHMNLMKNRLGGKV